MSRLVFDASTLLISINREQGFDAVDTLVREDDISMSSVNVAEVITKMTLQGSAASDIETVIGVYRLAVTPFRQQSAMAAGTLVTRTRHRGLSLADRACLALGMELKLPVVTADRAWAGLDLGLDIRLIR